jgi:RNA polymerase sigma-70 factor (ECF subfamily)
VREGNERELLRRIRRGERAACEEFVQMHYRSVYGLLFNLSRNAAQAEDLTQETFAAAWEHIGAFDGRGSFAAWLYRISYNKFLDAQRSQRRQDSSRTMARCAQRPLALSDNPAELAVSNERAAQLCEAIHRLEDASRDVIIMHYLQGLSFSEMAEVLGEPAGTVKWRVSQALARLRGQILKGKVEP